MIWCYKKNRENHPGKCFWTKEKETRIKIKPWVSVNFRAEKRSVQASAHPLSQAQGGNFLCVDCACLLLEFWVKCTRCERLLPVKHFYFTCLLFFRRLKITLDSEQPMLKEKRIIPSVCPKMCCFCVHSGAPDLTYPGTSLYQHIL